MNIPQIGFSYKNYISYNNFNWDLESIHLLKWILLILRPSIYIYIYIYTYTRVCAHMRIDEWHFFFGWKRVNLLYNLIIRRVRDDEISIMIFWNNGTKSYKTGSYKDRKWLMNIVIKI